MIGCYAIRVLRGTCTDSEVTDAQVPWTKLTGPLFKSDRGLESSRAFQREHKGCI